MFKNSFGYLVKEGLHNIRANRQMSVASIGVLIACMVLIGGALLLSLNINSLMGYVESFNEVVVWIDDDLGSAGTEMLAGDRGPAQYHLQPVYQQGGRPEGAGRNAGQPELFGRL